MILVKNEHKTIQEQMEVPLMIEISYYNIATMNISNHRMSVSSIVTVTVAPELKVLL